MSATTMIMLALLVLMIPAALLFLYAAGRNREPDLEYQTLPQATPIAQKTWAAHCKVEALDLAVMTGQPDEIRDARWAAHTAINDLITEIEAQKEARAHGEQTQ